MMCRNAVDSVSAATTTVLQPKDFGTARIAEIKEFEFHLVIVVELSRLGSQNGSPVNDFS
jgi:hypothetical protein